MGFFSTRRNNIVEARLRQMIASTKGEADFPDVHFDAAARYAQDHGGILYDDMGKSIIFDKVIDGENYSVFFHVGRGGRGTNVTLTKQPSARQMTEAYADEAYRKWQEPRIIPDFLEMSLKAGEQVKTRLFDADDLRDYFSSGAIDNGIPEKCARAGGRLFYAGFVETRPTLIVLATLFKGETTFKVCGSIEQELTPELRNDLVAWQEELVEGLRSIAAEAGDEG